MIEYNDINEKILIDEDNKKELDENLPLKQKKMEMEKDNVEQQENLKAILKELLTDLENPKNGKDVEENDDNNPKDVDLLLAFKANWNSEKKCQRCRYRTCLCLMFRVLLPFFTIIHLISIFQIMSIMNVLYDTIKN